MFLGKSIYASVILEHPERMDLVEDPYVIVVDNPQLKLFPKPYEHQDMVSVMTLLHDRGWETVNISSASGNFLVALFKNPRAKRKNQPEMEG
jgi:hypothetical protein